MHNKRLFCLQEEERTWPSLDLMHRPRFPQCRTLGNTSISSRLGFRLQHQHRPSRLDDQAGAPCKLLVTQDFHKAQVPVSRLHQTILRRTRHLQHRFFLTKVDRSRHRRTIRARHLGPQYKREAECNFKDPLEYLKVRTPLQILRHEAALSIPAAQAAQGRLLLQILSKS